MSNWNDEELPDLAETPPRPAAAEPSSEPREPASEPTGEPGDGEPDAASVTPYALELPAGLPAHDTPDGFEEHLAGFAEAAHQGGIPQNIAQRLVNTYVDSSYALDYQGEATMDGARDFMERRWGNEYSAKMASVRRAVSQLGQGFSDFLDRTGFGNTPAVIETLARFGAGELSLSRADAQRKLDAINGNPKHAHWHQHNLSSVERRRLAAEMQALVDAAGEADHTRPARDHIAEVRAERAHTNAKADARAEIMKMLNARDHPLNDRNHKGHGAALKQYHALLGKL